MAEEENKIEESKQKQESEIVTPEDFKFPNKEHYEKFFHCPKCESSAVYLDPEFIRNNIINNLEDKDTLKNVLKCVNCKHTDLLVNFLQQKMSSTFGSSYNPIRYQQPIKKYPSLIKAKKPSILWHTNKNKKPSILRRNLKWSV